MDSTGKKADSISVTFAGRQLSTARTERSDIPERFPDLKVGDPNVGFAALGNYRWIPSRLRVSARFGDREAVLLDGRRLRRSFPSPREVFKSFLSRGPLPLNHPVTGVVKGPVKSNLDIPFQSFLHFSSQSIRIAGWAFDDSGAPPVRIVATLGKRSIVLPSDLERYDVWEAHDPREEVPLRCGFDGEFRTGLGAKLVEVVAEWADGSRFLLGKRLFWVGRQEKVFHRKTRKQTRLRHRARNAELRSRYVKDCETYRQHEKKEADVCDVVIPVYKGLEETRLCLESLYRSRPLNRRRFEIVVIDDCGPEPELARFLAGEADAGRITLLRNEENLGFVATANRGMCLHPERDVILLNSDTEVFHSWVDRMLDAADKDSRIATITPFSNNGTICSYPTCAEDNDLPFRHPAESLDAFCSELNGGVTHTIPSGVGFCLFIRRRTVDTIGYFDVEVFGKGYGEENDFCLRAELENWRNVLLCDTFVYHKGAVSFLETKNPKVDAAVRIINEFYPGYDGRVQRFLQEDPAKEARWRLDERRLSEMPKARVLCISHARGGGTRQHIVEKSQRALETEGQLLLQPRLENDTYDLYFLPEMSRLNLPAGGVTQPEVAAFCQTWGIDRLEYHHLADQSQEIQDLPRRIALPYSFIAHDYHAYCPQITLTDAAGRYCGEPGLAACEACLRSRPVRGIRSVEKWRRQTGDFLNGAREVACPSEAARIHLGRHFPDAAIVVRPHRENNAEAMAQPPLWRQREDSPLVIGVLGALSREKGADLLEDAAVDAARRGLPLRFVLFGYAYRTLLGEPAAKLTITGAYKHDEIDALLAEHSPDLFWFPARWPETYSYTLSIALAGRYPVIVPDLGAFTERVKERPLSWIVPWNTSACAINGSLMKILEDFHANPNLGSGKHDEHSPSCC